MKDLYIVEGREDDADVIFDEDLNIVYIHDQFHRGNIDYNLIAALGHNYFRFYHDRFISDEEYKKDIPDTSDKIANIDLLKERLKEYLNGN